MLFRFLPFTYFRDGRGVWAYCAIIGFYPVAMAVAAVAKSVTKGLANKTQK